jgi:hypothetical protein
MDREVILERLFRRLYGSPIIQNNHRGELIEEIVAAALEPDWTLCARDWAAFDLQHGTSGLRIQVKQSAAKQTWAPPLKSKGPRFSIASKTGRYEGASWVAEAGRNADIFLFAWHPQSDNTCDHADPSQWQFFVVAERDLPINAKSVGLYWLGNHSASSDFANLGCTVNSVSEGLANR